MNVYRISQKIHPISQRKGISGLVFAMLLLVGLLSISGCAINKGFKFEKPDVELVSIRPEKISLYHQTLRLRLRVINPNTMELPVAALHCSVFLEGINFANGITEEHFAVPGKGELEFDMLVRVSMRKTFKNIKRLVKEKKTSVNYHISGTVKADILFVGDISYKKSGTLNLSEWEDLLKLQ